jgi:hypothetical protein
MKDNLTFEEDRRTQGKVAAMRIAVVAAVVREAIARVNVRSEFRQHGLRNKLNGADMDRQPEGRAHRAKLVIGDAAREVHGSVQNARSPSAKQRVDHVANHSFNAASQHDHGEYVNGRVGIRFGIQLHGKSPKAGTPGGFA